MSSFASLGLRSIRCWMSREFRRWRRWASVGSLFRSLMTPVSRTGRPNISRNGLVMLPSESHGYRARESIMHLLWETDRWLEKYVKTAPPREKTVNTDTTEVIKEVAPEE